MIKIKELKQLIIKGEIEFIEQVQHEDPKMYIDGIKDEINECDDINDIIEFYGNHGFELKTACKIIINLLMESAQLKENRLSNNNYGVFCIAAQLEQNNRELDVLWDKALKLYDEFRNSKFNNPEESELECINEFLNKKSSHDRI